MEKENLYFAAKEGRDCADILLGRASSFYNTLNSNAYFDKLARMWAGYHGIYGDFYDPGHKITFTGEQGELVALPVNHMRNIAQHMFNMVSANRPVMEAKAVNTDYKSLAQTYLANGILEYYMREKRLEEAIKRALEISIVMGSAFIQMSWNATGGEANDYDEETGKFNYEGELEFTVRSPFDVVFDGTKDSYDQTREWKLVRGRQNRYNLMAKYPELENEIRAVPRISDLPPWNLKTFSNDDTDDVFVYEFFHEKSEAVPKGRYMLFLSVDSILIDIDLPYRTIPIFRVAPNEILGTPYGYSPMFDIYPIQEAINALFSTIMTNQNAFGVQNIFVPRGADLNVNQIAGEMNILEGNAKPEVIELCATPAEVFKFLEYLVAQAETISGISSVTRGNPEASLRSASALALVQSMSLQFISGLQQSYVNMIEYVGNALIQILKDFAMTPKVVALVGKNKQSYLKEFTNEDIKDINRVTVDVGNPLARTIAGRVQMAEQMLQMGVIKNPEQYFQVINTGRLDSMYEGDYNELLLIKQENESMMEGKPVMATYLDAHRNHIIEHKAVLADPELRQNKDLVVIVLNHIQEHIDLLRSTDPDLLQLIGETPLAAQGEPMLIGNPQDKPPGDSQGNPSEAMTPQNPNVQSDLPAVAKPPAPFENLPVSPQELAPQ